MRRAAHLIIGLSKVKNLRLHKLGGKSQVVLGLCGQEAGRPGQRQGGGKTLLAAPIVEYNYGS